MKKALEIATSLISMGIDIETIIKATGLDKETIENIRIN
jgi:hypothetical protein